MSYDIYIGEGVLVVPKSEDDNVPRVEVRRKSLPNAPSFPGDPLTKNENHRHPGYGQWREFLEQVGLLDLFLPREGPRARSTCLMGEHPGAALLRKSDLAEVRKALARWRARDWPAEERVPGWDPKARPWDGGGGDQKYDGNLARLIWLEFWVAWALENCEMPTIWNF